MKKKSLEYIPLWKLLPEEEMGELHEYLGGIDRSAFDGLDDFDFCLVNRDTLKRIYQDFLDERSQEDTVGFFDALDKLEEGVLIDFSFKRGHQIIYSFNGMVGKTVKSVTELIHSGGDEYIRIDFEDNTFCVLKAGYDDVDGCTWMVPMCDEDLLEILREKPKTKKG